MRNAALEAYFGEYSVGAGLGLPLSVVSALIGDEDTSVAPESSDESEAPPAKIRKPATKDAREDSVSSVNEPLKAKPTAKAALKLAPLPNMTAKKPTLESSDSEDEAPKKPVAKA